MQPRNGSQPDTDLLRDDAPWFSTYRWPVICAAALVLITIIAYLPALQAGYIWDDDSYLTKNSLVQSPDGLGPIWSLEFDRDDSLLPIPRPNTPQYYPLVFTTFWLEYHFWGLEPFGYHLVNILLHALNAVLIWLIFSRLGIRGAWLIAALFALHPVHVESVAWISERKNVLSGLFYLCAAWCWLRFDERLEAPAVQQRGTPWTWAVAAFVSFVCALLSKSITCSLPAALILVMLYRRRAFTWQRIASLAPLFAIGLIAAFNTRSIELHHVGAIRFADELAYGLPDRILIASNALLFYIWKMVWPHPMVFIYPRWDIDNAGLFMWLAVPIVIAGGCALLWMYLRGKRGIPLALAYFAGTVLPALGLIALVYPHRFSFVADHFNYLSSIGILAILGVGITHLPLNRRLQTICATLILCILGTLTMRQTFFYYNAETLWRHTVQHNPTGFMPHNNLAAIYLRRAALAHQQNEPDERDRLAELARQHASASIRVKPDHHTAHNNLAGALRLLNRPEDALEFASEAAALAPHIADYHHQVARLARALAQTERSTAAYEHALEAAPNRHDVRLELADYLAEQEHFDQALEHVRQVIEAMPDHYPALLLAAGIQERRQRYDQADLLYTLAARRAQTQSDLLLLLPRIARFYANVDDPQFRSDEKALAAATELIHITQDSPRAIAVLGDVHFQAGRVEHAIQLLRDAAMRARRMDDHDFARALDERIESYLNMRDDVNNSSS